MRCDRIHSQTPSKQGLNYKVSTKINYILNTTKDHIMTLDFINLFLGLRPLIHLQYFRTCLYKGWHDYSSLMPFNSIPFILLDDTLWPRDGRGSIGRTRLTRAADESLRTLRQHFNDGSRGTHSLYSIWVGLQRKKDVKAGVQNQAVC